MSIYLVYCARHSTDKNGLTMPQADLQINLPEQVQYRFAGYIQAVIEQYAQELEASLNEGDEGSGSDVNSNDEGGERAKKKRRRQPKVMQEDGDEEDPLGSCFHCDCLANSLTVLRRCGSRRPRPCEQGLRIPSHNRPLHPLHPNHDYLLQSFYCHICALRPFPAHVRPNDTFAGGDAPRKMASRRYGVHHPDRTKGNARGTCPAVRIKSFFLYLFT